MPLQLPERPWLDLGIGTPADGPVTFSVQVLDGSTTRLLLRRTLTTPHRWESVSLDLSEYAGREIALSLSLSAAEDGRLGFWGSPAVRSRGPAVRSGDYRIRDPSGRDPDPGRHSAQ